MVQTAQKGYFKKGDVELIGLMQQRITKKATVEIEIGDILARFDDLTPSYFSHAVTASVKPFYMARGRTLKPSTGYFGNDAGSYVAALAADPDVSGVYEGLVTLDVSGSIHPGRYAKPLDLGKKVVEAAADNSEATKHCALFLGAPGQRSGEYIATVVTDGLGVFRWVGAN